MQEIWKPVVNFEGFLEISNLGRLKRIAFWHRNWKGNFNLIKKDKILKPTNDRGYEKIILKIAGHRHTFYLHRLVAQAFIPNPNNYKEVNHIDNHPWNNRVDNLEWCNRKYNINYMIKHQEEIKDRHERRIEALEMLLYYAETRPFVQSKVIKDLITDDMVGDY